MGDTDGQTVPEPEISTRLRLYDGIPGRFKSGKAVKYMRRQRRRRVLFSYTEAAVPVDLTEPAALEPFPEGGGANLSGSA